jgi:hypothetical protein
MKIVATKFITGTVAASLTALALTGCTYHRTVVERPVADTPSTTIVVPEQRKEVIVVPPN